MQGTGEFINTKFFCRVCSMLHDPKAQMEHFSYEDVNEWWRGKGTCINGSWRKFQKALEAEAKRNKTSENKEAKASVQPVKNDEAAKEISSDSFVEVAKVKAEVAKLP